MVGQTISHYEIAEKLVDGIPQSGAFSPRTLAALFLCTSFVYCQPGPSPGPLSAPAGKSALSGKLACADLRSLTGYEFTVASAAVIPANGELPEHCRVVGQILPQVGFEVDLPISWNRRFYMSGNGGYGGQALDHRGRASQRTPALRQGFAYAHTDTGHDASREPLATFAQDRQKLFDYAFRSLHATAETAKRIIAAYYQTAATHSYFVGCSGGGRQGLILAQRFPHDFDGIVAGAPALNFSGTMVSYTWIAQALAAAPIPSAKLPLLANRVVTQCDAIDGLADGLIDDPRRCTFQPSRDLPRCADGGVNPDCFTSAQIGTLEAIYGDVMSRGRRIFPGWPVGAEVAGPNGRSGWDGFIVRDHGQTEAVSFAESFFRYMAFPQRRAEFDLADFDFDRDPARLGWIHSVLDATESDLSRFRDRGGKLLMYFGWADAGLNPMMGVNYYEDVLETMGPETHDFFRLYMVPGMFHCSGGVGTSTFDMLTPLIKWTEQGTAPDRILSSRIVKGKPVRTRPLCPYPQVAKYKGTGSIDEAVNFTCVEPPVL